MKKTELIYRIFADFIFIFHVLVLAVILFGWAVPNIWHFYMGTLVITLLSELILGYCFLSKWEFDIRKKLNPEIDYDYSFSGYYTYKLTQHRISSRFLLRAGIIFLTTSILINVYFRFFYTSFL